MIVDGSFNAKALMLHGLLTEYIVETDDDSDLPIHISFDMLTCMPPCLPNREELRKALDNWEEAYMIKLLESYIDCDHMYCDSHTCRAD